MNESPLRQRLNSWDDLRERWGIRDSKATIYRKINAGKFPTPIYLGRSPAWTDEQLGQFIDAAFQGGADAIA